MTGGRLLENIRARLLPKDMAWLLAPCAWRRMMNRNAPISRIGRMVPPMASQLPQSLGLAISMGGSVLAVDAA